MDQELDQRGRAAAHLHSARGLRAVQARGWALRTLGLCKAGAPAESWPFPL